MKTAIINSGKLNNCWSALQYTGSCEQCDKVVACKIKSRHHTEGLCKFFDAKEQRLNNEHKEKVQKLQQEKNNLLNR